MNLDQSYTQPIAKRIKLSRTAHQDAAIGKTSCFIAGSGSAEPQRGRRDGPGVNLQSIHFRGDLAGPRCQLGYHGTRRAAMHSPDGDEGGGLTNGLPT